MRFYFPPIDLYCPSISEILLRNMTAFYAFDNAAGLDVPDSHGNGPDLPDNNGVDRAAGKHGDAADLDIASSEYLNILSANANAFKYIGSFSIGYWLYVVSLPDKGGGACYQSIFYRGATFQGGYSIRLAGVGSSIPFSIYGDSGENRIIHSSVTTGKWIFNCHVHDAPTKSIESWTDNSGTLLKEDSDTYTAYAATSRDTSIGLAQSGALSGRIYLDDLVFFEKALTQEEIEWIYNSGSGRAYADYVL